MTVSDYIIRPLVDRPQFASKPRRSAFGSDLNATKTLLLAEVNRLDGSDLALGLDVVEGQITKTGRALYSGVTPSTPSVAVFFDSRHGALTYSTGAFTDWRDNLRAIALALEALRKVDRYGVSNAGQQYAGWKALPSPSGSSALAPHLTEAEAMHIITEAAGYGHPATIVLVRGYFRRARSLSHPDRHEGDRTQWDMVEAAGAALGLL